MIFRTIFLNMFFYHIWDHPQLSPESILKTKQFLIYNYLSESICANRNAVFQSVELLCLWSKTTG